MTMNLMSWKCLLYQDAFCPKLFDDVQSTWRRRAAITSGRGSSCSTGHAMVAEKLRHWLERMGSKTTSMMPGSPLENGYCGSFNGRLRDELLNGETFYTLKEV